jgi:hypothetical protein
MYDRLSNNYDNTRKISSSSNHDYDNPQESGKKKEELSITILFCRFYFEIKTY